MKNITYIILLVGVGSIYYANYKDNKYLLILGIIILMLGLFRINKKLISNQKKDNLEIRTEIDKNKKMEDE